VGGAMERFPALRLASRRHEYLRPRLARRCEVDV